MERNRLMRGAPPQRDTDWPRSSHGAASPGGGKPVRPRRNAATTSPYRTPIPAASFYKSPPLAHASPRDGGQSTKRARPPAQTGTPSKTFRMDLEEVVAEPADAGDTSRDEIDFLRASPPRGHTGSGSPPSRGPLHMRMRTKDGQRTGVSPLPSGDGNGVVEVPLRAFQVNDEYAAREVQALTVILFKTHFVILHMGRECAKLSLYDVTDWIMGGAAHKVLGLQIRPDSRGARALEDLCPVAQLPRGNDVYAYLFPDTTAPSSQEQWSRLEQRVRRTGKAPTAIDDAGVRTLLARLQRAKHALQLPGERREEVLSVRYTDTRTGIRTERRSEPRPSDAGSSAATPQKPSRPSPALEEVRQPLGRRTRSQSMREERQARDALNKPILRYPPAGPFAVTLLGSDLERLEEDEYLNDTLIEFGLRFLYEQLKAHNADLAQTMYMFSSFFYLKMSEFRDHTKSYQQVRKWTSRVDIFSKKYLVVPINENLHWYLAVVVNPGAVLQEREPQPSRGGDPHALLRARRRSSRHASSAENSDADPDVTAIEQSGAATPEPIASGADTHHTPERPADKMDVDTDLPQKQTPPPQTPPGSRLPGRTPTKITPGESRRTPQPAPQPEAEAEEPDAQQAYVLVFDSLRGGHSPVKTVLRDYLRLEARDKGRVPQDIDLRRLGDPVHVDVRVPAQNNWSDCGVYLLHYFERFFSDPARFLEIALAPKKGTALSPTVHAAWREDALELKRSWWRLKVLELGEQWRKQQTSAPDAADSDEEPRSPGGGTSVTL